MEKIPSYQLKEIIMLEILASEKWMPNEFGLESSSESDTVEDYTAVCRRVDSFQIECRVTMNSIISWSGSKMIIPSILSFIQPS